jgi:hypothetical protein
VFRNFMLFLVYDLTSFFIVSGNSDSAVAEKLLSQIPDLGFMLQSCLVLPKL